MANDSGSPESAAEPEAGQEVDRDRAERRGEESGDVDGTRSSLLEQKIRVHVESDTEVDLQAFDRQAGKWRKVCQSPCDIEVAAGERFRIEASGVRASSSFKLDGALGSRVVLRVDAASSTAHTVGVTLIIVGAAPVTAAAVVAVGGAVVLGVVVILACPFVAAFGGDFGECAGDVFGAGAKEYANFITRPVVLGILGGGVAVGVTGIVLTSKNSSTDVDVTPQPAGPQPAATLPPAAPFGPRSATMLPDVLQDPPLPRAAAFPVISGTF